MTIALIITLAWLVVGAITLAAFGRAVRRGKWASHRVIRPSQIHLWN